MKRLSFVIFMALASATVSADTLTLLSGSRLSGTAGIVKGDKLVFTSEDLGDIEVPLAKIASLDTPHDHTVQYNDYTRETKSMTVSNGVFIASGKPLDTTNVKAIDPGIETWHGSVNASYTAARGNTYQNSASLLANVNRRWEEDRVNADFGYYYSETGTSKDDRDKTTDRWEVEGQHDHFWRPAVYTFENARYEEDSIAGLDNRVRLGLGVGYQWLDARRFETTGVWSFNQEAGATWFRDNYRVRPMGGDESYAALRYAHHLTYIPKWNEGVNGFHNLEYYPQIDDWEHYIMKADVGFTTKIIMDFNFIAKIEWEYNSRPSVGRKSSDIRYIVGLGYAW